MIAEIWQSFRRLPLWVQLWIAIILVPVNLASLLFLSSPQGTLIAMLAIGGMAPNLIIMMRDHGFSRVMSLPHLLIWTPLVIVVIRLLSGDGELPATYRQYLILLLFVDLVSLAFDVNDALRWWRGDRGAA